MYQAATASSAAVPFFGPYKVYRNPAVPVAIAPGSHSIPLPDLFPEVKGDGDTYELVDGGNGGLANPALFAALEDTPASAGKTKIILSLGHRPRHRARRCQDGCRRLLPVARRRCVAELPVRRGIRTWSTAACSTLREERGRVPLAARDPKTLAFLDEGSVEDMNALEDMAQAFIAANDKEIDEFIKILTLPQFEHV